MINQPTVLILGAGASKPFGFPVGRKLTADVLGTAEHFANFWKNNPEARLFYDLNITPGMLRNFHTDLQKSNLQSVDAFVENRSEYIELGKIMIAYHLLPSENKSKLMRSLVENEKWFEYVWRKWGATPESIGDGQLSFVTFNYDRSLEYLLLNSISGSFGLDNSEAAKLVEKLPIFHVYGSLGEPYFFSKGESNLSCGAPISTDSIRKTIQNITIIHEDQDIPRYQEIQDSLSAAEIISFIGFGYHRTNLKRLFKSVILDHKNVFGSAYGLGEGEMESIAIHFSEYYKIIAGGEYYIRLGNHAEKSEEFLKAFPIFPA